MVLSHTLFSKFILRLGSYFLLMLQFLIHDLLLVTYHHLVQYERVLNDAVGAYLTVAEDDAAADFGLVADLHIAADDRFLNGGSLAYVDSGFVRGHDHDVAFSNENI